MESLHNTYTVDYFIEKFEKIPENNWCRNRFREGDKYCAQGHCGMNMSNAPRIWAATSAKFFPESLLEGFWLVNLFKIGLGSNVVGEINNGIDTRYRQQTPKKRILAALHDIRDKLLQNENIKAAIEIINGSVQLKCN